MLQHLQKTIIYNCMVIPELFGSNSAYNLFFTKTNNRHLVVADIRNATVEWYGVDKNCGFLSTETHKQAAPGMAENRGVKKYVAYHGCLIRILCRDHIYPCKVRYQENRFGCGDGIADGGRIAVFLDHGAGGRVCRDNYADWREVTGVPGLVRPGNRGFLDLLLQGVVHGRCQ